MSERVTKTLQLLSDSERRDLIVTYRDYVVLKQHVDPSIFGSRLNDSVDEAVTNGDKGGVLKSGARDVVSNYLAILEHEEATKMVPFFESRLSKSTMSNLNTFATQRGS